MSYTDWIGFAGVFILLVAYALNLVGKLSQNSVVYLLLNFLGAFISCIASMLLHFVPFIILEGVWTLVSIIGLLSKLFKNDQ